MENKRFLEFMYERHKDTLVKILEGHGELLTPALMAEYREWLLECPED